MPVDDDRCQNAASWHAGLSLLECSLFGTDRCTLPFPSCGTFTRCTFTSSTGAPSYRNRPVNATGPCGTELPGKHQEPGAIDDAAKKELLQATPEHHKIRRWTTRPSLLQHIAPQVLVLPFVAMDPAVCGPQISQKRQEDHRMT